MPPRISVRYDDQELIDLLRRLEKRWGDLSPMMRSIASELVDGIEQTFEDQVNPLTGAPWTALTPSTIAERVVAGNWPGKILQRSGTLARSFTPFHGRYYAGAGTPVEYAAIQNFGGTTRPHIIKPKSKKALAFAGKIFGAVHHPGSTVPARPFLYPSQETRDTIIDLATEYVWTDR